jgi:hypothetical protein
MPFQTEKHATEKLVTLQIIRVPANVLVAVYRLLLVPLRLETSLSSWAGTLFWYYLGRLQCL